MQVTHQSDLWRDTGQWMKNHNILIEMKDAAVYANSACEYLATTALALSKSNAQ